MARHYVTFGQQHVHKVNGHTLDKDSIACYNAADCSQGRDKAFRLFGRSFFTDYHENENRYSRNGIFSKRYYRNRRN